MVDSVMRSVKSTCDTSSETSRKKRRISADETEARRIGQDQAITRSAKRWRTDREQQIYSSKLVEALSRVRGRSDEAGKVFGGVREIRDTADRVLAASARGTSRWSRAILVNRIRARLKKYKKAKVTANSRLRKISETVAERPKRRRLPPVEGKMKVLGRLVPGCRKISFPNLLEEATDYIAALEMQVRTMTALVELLAAAPPLPPPPPASP